MSNNIRSLIRSLVEEALEEQEIKVKVKVKDDGTEGDELEETTSSGAAGPFNTPFAFRGNSKAGKEKQKKNATQAGYQLVKGKEDKADPEGDPEERSVQFGKGTVKKPINELKYQDFKKAEGLPRQKIGRAMKEINRQLYEIARIVNQTSKLKTEMGVENAHLWKSTVEGLVKLEARLNTIASKIQEFKI